MVKTGPYLCTACFKSADLPKMKMKVKMKEYTNLRSSITFQIDYKIE